MPTLHEFLTGFGWPEAILTAIIVIIIVAAREWNHLFGRSTR